MGLVRHKFEFLGFAMRQMMHLGLVLLLVAPLSQAQADDYVTEAEKWFAGVTTMKADFVQVVSDGSITEGDAKGREDRETAFPLYGQDRPCLLLQCASGDFDHLILVDQQWHKQGGQQNEDDGYSEHDENDAKHVGTYGVTGFVQWAMLADASQG